MTCGVIDFLQGGLLQDARIVDPSVSGGVFIGPELGSPVMKGSVSLDDAALASLLNILNPVIDPTLDPAEVAAVFQDSASGLPLVPNAGLVTKETLAATVSALKNTINAKTDPAAVAGVLRDSTNNLPLVPDTQVATKNDLEDALDDLKAEIETEITPAEIAGVFNNKDGNPLSPGTKLLSEQEIADQIQLAICGGGGQGIASIVWDPTSRQLTFTLGDDTTRQVTLTNLVSGNDSYAGTVAAPAGTDLPTKVAGSRDYLLGKPDNWLRVTVNGAQGVVPWFAV
jgi:hypothetical protein